MSAGNDFVHTVFILYHCIYTSFWGYFLTGIIEYIFFPYGSVTCSILMKWVSDCCLTLAT